MPRPKLVPAHGLHRIIVSTIAIVMIASSGLVARTNAEDLPTIQPGDGLAATQFVWLLDRINTGGGDISAEEITAHFTARFVAAVGVDAIAAQVHEAAVAYAPLTIVTVIQETEDLVHVQARAKDSALVVIAVSIEHSDEKIAGFIFQPGEADRPFATPAGTPEGSPVASPAA
ncbi:MAG: Cpe/LpqF family protein [Thermomicrobiales bacterium]